MSLRRRNYSSGTRWESKVGYSRAVRFGNFVYISGTTATNKEHNIVGIGNTYAQTIQSMKNIEIASRKVGATLKDVVRTRIHVTDIISNWEKVGKAHAEYFEQIRPATTMVEVSRLIIPEVLVEMEADAIMVSGGVSPK